jgi:hypothetical protein
MFGVASSVAEDASEGNVILVSGADDEPAWKISPVQIKFGVLNVR